MPGRLVRAPLSWCLRVAGERDIPVRAPSVSESFRRELNPNGRVSAQGIVFMADEQDRTPSVPDNSVVRRLVREAHITEEQARELIAFLGYDWPSLIREARFLTRKR